MAGFNSIQTEHYKVKIPTNNVSIAELVNEDLVGDYQVPIFRASQLKDDMKSLYSQMEQTDEVKEDLWRKFLTKADIYAQLKYDIKKRFNGQFANNSWLKFYEMVNEYKLLPKSDEEIGDNFNVFLNAELPGSAASALNHYVKAQGIRQKFDWKASSLCSEKADGDEYGLVAENPARWMMNKTNIGDMTVATNVLDIAQRFGVNSGNH